MTYEIGAEPERELSLSEELTRRIHDIKTFTTSSYSKMDDLHALLQGRAAEYLRTHLKLDEEGLPHRDTPDGVLVIQQLVEDGLALLKHPPEQVDCPAHEPATLKAFITDYLNGEIFIMQDLGADLEPCLRTVFMVVGLGGTGNIKPESIGTIYEYLHKAGPRSANGYPSFFSCSFMNKEDWAKARELILLELERRRNAESFIDDALGIPKKEG